MASSWMPTATASATNWADVTTSLERCGSLADLSGVCRASGYTGLGLEGLGVRGLGLRALGFGGLGL